MTRTFVDELMALDLYSEFAVGATIIFGEHVIEKTEDGALLDGRPISREDLVQFFIASAQKP